MKSPLLFPLFQRMLVVITLTGSVDRLLAGSFALNEQSVSGLGTAYAGGAAAAEDASSLFFNPAGIVILNQGELQLGAHYVDPTAHFQNTGSVFRAPGTIFDGIPLSGGSGGDGGVAHVLPNAYLSQPILRGSSYGDLTIGLGLSVPFGLETDYNPDWVGRYSALRTKLTTFDIQPTIAYRLFDRLSLGASLDIQYASARLSQAVDYGAIGAQTLGQFYAALPQTLAGAGVPAVAIPGVVGATQQAYAAAGFVPQRRDGVVEVDGDSWALGFTVGGVLEYLKPDQNEFFQDGRIGVSYRSGISHTLHGNARFGSVPLLTAPGAPVQFPQPGVLQALFYNQGDSATAELPEIYRISIYQKFLHRFAVLGDVSWTRWSRLQAINIKFDNPATPVNSLLLQYDDATRYSIGFEWYANDQLTFRTGFAYDETPIRDDTRRTPRIPDNNRYLVTAGLQYKPLSWLAFDLGYGHLFVDDPTVNTLDTTGHNLRGTFDASVDIVSASITLLWGGPKKSVPQPEGKAPVSYSK